MSTFAERFHEAPRLVLAPWYRQSGMIRAFVHAVLLSLDSGPKESEETRVLLARYETVIAAARSAFGGTIAW